MSWFRMNNWRKLPKWNSQSLTTGFEIHPLKICIYIVCKYCLLMQPIVINLLRTAHTNLGRNTRERYLETRRESQTISHIIHCCLFLSIFARDICRSPRRPSFAIVSGFREVGKDQKRGFPSTYWAAALFFHFLKKHFAFVFGYKFVSGERRLRAGGRSLRFGALEVLLLAMKGLHNSVKSFATSIMMMVMDRYLLSCVFSNYRTRTREKYGMRLYGGFVSLSLCVMYHCAKILSRIYIYKAKRERERDYLIT